MFNICGVPGGTSALLREDGVCEVRRATVREREREREISYGGKFQNGRLQQVDNLTPRCGARGTTTVPVRAALP